MSSAFDEDSSHGWHTSKRAFEAATFFGADAIPRRRLDILVNSYTSARRLRASSLQTFLTILCCAAIRIPRRRTSRPSWMRWRSRASSSMRPPSRCSPADDESGDARTHS
eukprot:5621749-Pleurochrysis_carterae.AAC.2